MRYIWIIPAIAWSFLFILQWFQHSPDRDHELPFLMDETTLQAQIDEASHKPPHILFLDEGRIEIHGTVTVPKNVSIIGRGPHPVVLQAKGDVGKLTGPPLLRWVE